MSTDGVMFPLLAITAIGMVTAAGYGAHASCAALRSGVSMMRELDYFAAENDEGEKNPVIGCQIQGLADGVQGVGRWTEMGVFALRDLVQNGNLGRHDLLASRLYVALPLPDRPGVPGRIGGQPGPRFGELLDAGGLEREARFCPEGHAAALKATIEAGDALQRGEITRAIVGGIDSLIEPDRLAHFLERKRLKTEDNLDGFIPGEGAAFFSLERLEVAQARGAGVLAVIDGGGISREPETIWSEKPSAASGLSQAVNAALMNLPDRGAGTGLVVGDLTGETYRAREFGLTVPRVLRYLQAGWTLWHPADCIGDTGAASGAISVCMAARAFRRGYARTSRALVFGSSDDGLRAALTLRSAA